MTKADRVRRRLVASQYQVELGELWYWTGLDPLLLIEALEACLSLPDPVASVRAIWSSFSGAHHNFPAYVRSRVSMGLVPSERAS